MSADNDLIVLPPGPRCRRCGHEVCPCCADWCDTVVEVTDDDGNEDIDACCSAECDLDAEAVNEWLVRCHPFIDDEISIVTAEGPCEFG